MPVSKTGVQAIPEMSFGPAAVAHFFATATTDQIQAD
jgi:hypothetical protein